MKSEYNTTWSEDITAWQLATFGAVTPPRAWARFAEEFEELVEADVLAAEGLAEEAADEELVEADVLAAEGLAEEAADVVITLAAWVRARTGLDLATAVDAKMQKNRARKWDVRGDGTGYHVKGAIKPKNGFLFCRELPERESTTAGGIILLADSLKVGDTAHEVEVVASTTPDLHPGDRVIISVRGVSAFHQFEAEMGFSIPEREVWARVTEHGEIIPRHGQVLTERDDVAMRRYAFGDSPLHLPESHLRHGLSAGDVDDPTAKGARARDAVTCLYERVVRRGPEVLDADLVPGTLVAFSPSYCSTRLQRLTQAPFDSRAWPTITRHYHLVEAGEIFFAVEGA